MSSRLLVRVAVSMAAGMAVLVALIAIQPPAWIVLLLGSMALAGLYIYARMNSRYDSLDPRFGSCIPPLPRSKDQ
jgi:1,4-dihydroxy-2-naphthoate octaprenyltransferase